MWTRGCQLQLCTIPTQTQPHKTASLALERWVDEDDSFALHFPNYLQCCFIVCYVSLIGVLC